MKPDLIVEYLQRFPMALQRYLEHLVYVKNHEVIFALFQPFINVIELKFYVFCFKLIILKQKEVTFRPRIKLRLSLTLSKNLCTNLKKKSCINCWFASDVTVAMLFDKNKSVSFHWKLNSFSMHILGKRSCNFRQPTWPPITQLETINRFLSPNGTLDFH